MIKITKYSLKTKNVKSKKILIISDTHSDIYNEVEKAIETEKPDFMVICGDVIDNKPEKDDWTKMKNWLSNISKKISIYISLGNHDVFYAQKEKVVEMLKETGVIVLDNDIAKYDDLLIYGYTPIRNRDFVYPNNFPAEKERTLLLCHRPNDFYEKRFLNENFLLTISGHCHGGQWRFFGKGVYAPDQGLFPKYTSGFYFDNKLLVSRGLANKCKIPRINNKPEIIILNIN